MRDSEDDYTQRNGDRNDTGDSREPEYEGGGAGSSPSPEGSRSPTDVSVRELTGSAVTPSPVPQQTMLVTETESPSKTDKPDYLVPISAIGAILAAMIMAALLARSIHDKWKYGKNAVQNLRGLKRAIGIKNELSRQWLKKRRSANIHAIGVGFIEGTNDYCIQVFVEDANADMLEDPPTRLLPPEVRGLPLVVYEMPRAELLNSDEIDRARRGHDVLCGGISAANVNLSGEFGTIGYFFRPRLLNRAKSAFLKNDVYVLSNSHVFADLGRNEKDETDLIIQPSPGDSSGGRVVAELFAYEPIDFGGDVERPNLVDAAIARLSRGQAHRAEIPRIGKINGHLRKESVTLRTACQKFGRTTGHTSGAVFSIHLSIWVKYSARGAEAFFSDQFLILPADATSFVKGGDSGSIVVDADNRALGLIFAGAGEKTALQFPNAEQALGFEHAVLSRTTRIESYGVANSIGDVMRAFGIKLDG